MKNLKKSIREVLKNNGIEYTLRDYYKLSIVEKDPKIKDLYSQYGLMYFISLPTEDYSLKLSAYKKSKKIRISYKDIGDNNYFSISCGLDDFDQKIKECMYLIDCHLKIINDMERFASGKVSTNIIRGSKIESISK